MHPLAERLLDHIRKHEPLTPGDRVGVAVSGGVDSIALLRLLLELRKDLGIVLSVVHLNHKLRRAESDADQEFVSRVAAECKLVLHATSADVTKHANEKRLSVETAARELRYAYFEQLLQDKLLDKIVTGHTLDDQAETILMRLIRGTGMRGLRGIQPRLEFETDSRSCEIVRPLLNTRRSELTAYLNSLGQPWREDSTNRETKYTRNRVRQVLLPLLEREFNPSVAENLAELAEIARAEEDYWESEIEGWMGTVVQWAPAKPATPENYVPLNQLISAHSLTPSDDRVNATVDRNWLLAEPLALQRRVIKSIGDYADIPLEFKHVEEILEFAAGVGHGQQLTLPGGWEVKRAGGSLEFKAADLKRPVESDYEYSLPVPGEVEIKEAGLRLRAASVDPEALANCAGDELFDSTRLSQNLVVRNWRPGDRFWPAHTKGPKKIKELLQEKHIPQTQRRLWPVVVSGDEIIWMRGFPGRAHFRPVDGRNAVLISELSLDQERSK